MQFTKMIFSFCLLFLLVNCGKEETPPTPPPTVDTGELKLQSLLLENIRLDDAHTCQGANQSPRIFWTNTYSTTATYVVMASNGLTGNDQEIYWLLSDIPANITEIKIGQQISGAIEGPNFDGKTGYAGPCPTEGTGKQNYQIQLFALNKTLKLNASATVADILNAMDGSILEEATFTTYYSSFEVTSENFANGETIPVIHSCDGDHLSPQLSWSKGHPGAVTYALQMLDVDARDYLHWLLCDINESVILEGKRPTGSVAGNNEREAAEYFGPCPGAEKHRYYFRLYALDKKLELSSGFSLKEMESAMEGHILDQTDFYAVYK